MGVLIIRSLANLMGDTYTESGSSVHRTSGAKHLKIERAERDVSKSILFFENCEAAMMKKMVAIGACVLLSLANLAPAADWKPAKGPLATRWSKDVSTSSPLPEYPRPQLVRKDWLNLNGVWQLAPAKAGAAVPSGQDLDERILVPFPVESALSGVMRQGDRWWYRRTFNIPAEWAGRRVLLHLGAVDWESTVWLNGKKMGQHSGGYDPFSFDITDALQPAGLQELIVGVWDPTDQGSQPRGKQVNRPGGIFYTPTTGIWQTVWLEPVSPRHISALKIVPDIDRSEVRITVQVGGAGDAEAVVRVMDGEHEVSMVKGPVGKELTVKVPSAKLWSPDAPFLYGLHVQLPVEVGDNKGPAADEVTSYFGMRKISVSKDGKGVNRVLLNGNFVFQVGPLDQGFWPDGLYTAPTDAALKYDIEITKQLGFNMTRKHVKVEPDRWYYWCDRLGLLVWQDMPSGDNFVGPGKGEITRTPESARQYELELKRMIDNLHNHPSIVMWVVFNEGWGQFDTVRITNWTKQYDPTRLVNCASGWNDMPAGDVHDIHVYPGPGAPPPEAMRAGVLGEFGGLGLAVDEHTWTNKTWGYRGAASRADLTHKYERLLREVHRLKTEAGLNAAVYTQITDVETEANGLLTYDREVIKVDLDRVAAVNRGDVSHIPEIKTVVATSQSAPQSWRFTFDKPGDDWFKPGFDTTGWKGGPGGFGTEMTPGAVVRTVWNSKEIWLRREITLPPGPIGDLRLLVHHDEDVAIYINGILAAKADGYSTDYEEMPISADALGTLKPGKNLLAVSCRQTGGGQYIDVGLVRLEPARR